jgi:hypothetical protein
MELRIASDDLKRIERRALVGQRVAIWLSLAVSLTLATVLLAAHATPAPSWLGLPAAAWGTLAGAVTAFALAWRQR